MASRDDFPRVRKRPEERRAEIIDAASTLALDEGLERVTLRAVAERLGVRPGLITHYFPAAEDLVSAAFARAATIERERFFPAADTPILRLSHFVGYLDSGASAPLAKLWLNARHLSRFSPALAAELERQDVLDRGGLTEIVAAVTAERGIEDVTAEEASTRILLAVDGVGSYANSPDRSRDPLVRGFIIEVTEWVLRLPAGTLPAPVP